MNYMLVHRFMVLCLLLSSLAACGGQDGSSETTTTQNGPSAPPQPPPPPNVPPGVPAISAQTTTSFLSSPVPVFFSLANFTVGAPGAPHVRFSVDGGEPNDFYIGTGNDSEIGVQFNGVHTHFAHWISPKSFELFGLAAGPHSVAFTLVDGANQALPNAEAKATYRFTVQQPPSGNLQLQRVLGGLEFPVSLNQASDGRMFFNELGTGKIRVINSNWVLDPTTFCSLPVQANGEQGLLGLVLDPNFLSNHTLYVYYTAQGSTNRVSKLVKQAAGPCTETPILTNLPTSGIHNGGFITIGPADGHLYVVVGDAGVPSDAQDLNSLAGKILRVKTDGSAAPGNPFSSSTNANAQKVYSLGHRNSFGLAFHPDTGHLWESENGPNSPQSDEVNRVIAGSNYGWDSNGQSGCRNSPPLVDPIVVFPIFAPTGIVAIPSNSSVYPSAYQGNVLVAGFNDGTIRSVIANPSALCGSGNTRVAFSGGVGGLLSLMRASDGYVYASTEDSIYRVVANSH